MSGYDWNTPPDQTDAPDRLKVATAQFAICSDFATNLAHILRLSTQAAQAGAQVVHFPEGALSGYGPADWPDWTGFDWAALKDATDSLCKLASDLVLWIVCGTVQPPRTPEALPSNSVLVINPDGQISGRYDKQRCSANDRRAFAQGDQPMIFEIEGVKCAVLICLDWAFPELWAELSEHQVELVFHSAASDKGGDTPHIASTVIPSVMQSYAWLHHYAISLSNSARPGQHFASLWVQRSGHFGQSAMIDTPGLALNALKDASDQDAFFSMVRDFRQSARSQALNGDKPDQR
ncbi:MAG: carbon-nitrogen hydrolase family protein [Alphaproteobacteria bacterium]